MNFISEAVFCVALFISLVAVDIFVRHRASLNSNLAMAVTFCVCITLYLLFATWGSVMIVAGFAMHLPANTVYTHSNAEQPGSITSPGHTPIWVYSYDMPVEGVEQSCLNQESVTGPAQMTDLKRFDVQSVKGERFFIESSTGTTTFYLLGINSVNILVLAMHESGETSVDEQLYFRQIVKSIAEYSNAAPLHHIPLWFLIVGLFLPRTVLVFSLLYGTLPFHDCPFIGSILSFLFTPRILIAVYTFQNGQSVWCCLYLAAQASILAIGEWNRLRQEARQ